MKTMKIILSLTLALVLLCGCSGSSVTAEDLAGQWTTIAPCSQEDADYLMDYMDLYPEERAFVDISTMSYVLTANFGADGSCSFAYEAEANKACVRKFYEGVMDALYENRAQLSDLYGADTAAMSREEFDALYAELYYQDSFETLMNELVNGAYDYDVLSEPLAEGTFKIVGENLMLTADGETSSIGLALDGDTLTLTYIDGTEVYTRVK